MAALGGGGASALEQMQRQQQPGQGDDFDYEDEEEMPATERELADDAEWKLIQKNTFARWANEHLKTVNKNLSDLEHDFSDGLRLIALIEVLSGEKIRKYNKRPSFRTQKLENVTMVLRFLEHDEGVRLVNIDSSHIVDNNLKLILGLIWTLILHYSISMPQWEDEDFDDDASKKVKKDQTPKQRLLNWVQGKIPDRPIKNFTTDWNDGTLVGALVDAMAPGLCPDWEDFDPKKGKDNATEAIEAAEKWLNVPQLIKPEEMVNPKIDEHSMMTYLSQFPNAKLKEGAPLRPKTNAKRVRAYGPGIDPTGNCVNAPARFTVETFSAGRGEIEVIVLNPQGQQEKCSVTLDNKRNQTYSCVYTPTVKGAYKIIIRFAGVEIPKSPFTVEVDAARGNADLCKAFGPGVEMTGVQVNKKTYFEVSAVDAGVGVVDVAVLDPRGHKDAVRPLISSKTPELWYIEYTAEQEGIHSVNVFFAGKPVPNSPFGVAVSPAGKIAEIANIPSPQECSPVDAARASYTTPTNYKPTQGKQPAARKQQPGEAMIKPQKNGPGNNTAPKRAQPTYGQVPMKRQPADANKVYATGRGIQPKGLRVNEDAEFRVHTEKAGEGELVVKVISPDNREEKLRMKRITENEAEIIYKPMKVGAYRVEVTYGGQSIARAPFNVQVGPKGKDSKILAYGPGLEGGVVDMPALFTVETNGETGNLGFSIEGPSEAAIDCQDNGDGSANVSYMPKAAGEYAVHILCDNEDINKSPFMADIKPNNGDFDASKVTASGPGLEPTGVTVMKWAEFTVDTRQASKPRSKVPLHISALDKDMEQVEVVVKDNKDGTYACRYMPKNNVKHTIIIAYGGVAIPNSPFKVDVSEASNPSKVIVSGPAVENKAVKTFEPTYLVVDCSQAGPGDVAISLTDEQGLDVKVDNTIQSTAVYRVDFEPEKVGKYDARVFFAGQEIPMSPYKINVIPSIDVSKVKIEGLQERVFLESTTNFTVDATKVPARDSDAPAAVVKAFVTIPDGQRMEAIVTDNQDGTYKCEYAPFKEGPHKIDVTYEGLQIPESPFTIQATPGHDSSRVKAYGPGLQGGLTEQPATFVVETNGAGQGGLGLAIEGPCKAETSVVDNKDGSCSVEYLPTKPGKYDIAIKFADEHIPGSPFKAEVVEEIHPEVVRCFGPGVEATGVRATIPTRFTVDTTAAGQAPLKVKVTDDSGKPQQALIEEISEDAYTVSYTPTKEGPCNVDVTYDGVAVPNSPFKTNVEPRFDASRVKVTGEGVRPEGVLASLPVAFTVDARDAGVADLDVQIGYASAKPLSSVLKDNLDGTYVVEYVPEYVGELTAKVQYGGEDVKNSPFKINVDSTGDASKVKIVEGLRTKIAVGEECVINIDATEAGIGQISCSIAGDGREVDISVVDNGDGTISIIYTPQTPGQYSVDIKFGGMPIPNGQFDQEAVPQDELDSQVCNEDQINPEKANNNASSAPSDFMPVDFCIPIGPVFNFVSAQVTTPSGKTDFPTVDDNKDGTVTIRYEPTEVGLHSLDVTYNDVPISGSPFKFHVDAIDSGYVTAHGPGLSHGVSGTQASFTIVTKHAGAGGLGIAIEGPSNATLNCVDNKDGTCTVDYLPTAAGQYSINIKFADKDIAGSPFKANITPASADDRQRAKITVGSNFDVSINVEEDIDLDSLMATITYPSGEVDQATLKLLPNNKLGISFTEKMVGEHLVNVYRRGVPIANSPFKVTVSEKENGNAKLVKATGKGLVEGHTNEVNKFSVDTKDAGYGGLSLSIEGPSKADLECHDNENGSCLVTYVPTEPGKYVVNIKFADEHVPGSPYIVKIDGEPSTKLTGQYTSQRQATDTTHIGSECELSLKIPGTDMSELKALVTSPNGVTEMAKITRIEEGHYSIKFVPREMGVHTISVKRNDTHIHGSPFQFTVGAVNSGGAHKVRAIGPGLQRGEVNSPAHFNVYTREAGAGGLGIAIEGPSKAEISFQDRDDGSSGVSYICSEPGDYLASIKFNDQHIPDSPFKVQVSPKDGDIHKLNVEKIQENLLQVNRPASFSVDFNGARGDLDAKVQCPSGDIEEAIITEVGQDKYTVRFIPKENGVHMIFVRLNGEYVPGSPYRVFVGQQKADPALVNAYGDGLVKGQTGTEGKFIVNTSKAGSGVLGVTVDGPSKVSLHCQELSDVGYEFGYTPTAAGEYLIAIKYAGAHVPGSPFAANVNGDAGTVHHGAWMERSSQRVIVIDDTEVTTTGSGLTEAKCGQITSYNVDASNTAMNMLLVGIIGPGIPEFVKVNHVGGNKFKVDYKINDKGKYMMSVKYGEDHVKGSPFEINVK